MEALREWAVGLCCISCACFIVYYILPSGKLTETAKKIVSVLCLSAMTVPLLSGSFELPEFNFDSFADTQGYDSQELSRRLSNAACVSVKSAAQTSINSVFNGTYEIYVSADIQPDNCIIINELRVVLINGDCDVALLKERLRRDTGIAVVIEDEREG